MTAATTDHARTWVDRGTRLLLDVVDTLDDAALDRPSGLPGWTRRHLLAHVASNAEALGRLLDWARTGVENPMYASPEARDARASRLALAFMSLVRRTILKPSGPRSFTRLRWCCWERISVGASIALCTPESAA